MYLRDWDTAQRDGGGTVTGDVAVLEYELVAGGLNQSGVDIA